MHLDDWLKSNGNEIDLSFFLSPRNELKPTDITKIILDQELQDLNVHAHLVLFNHQFIPHLYIHIVEKSISQPKNQDRFIYLSAREILENPFLLSSLDNDFTTDPEKPSPPVQIALPLKNPFKDPFV